MVGHLALDQSIGVRIPVSQPIFPTQNGCRRASVFSILMMYGGHQVTGAPDAGFSVLGALPTLGLPTPGKRSAARSPHLPAIP